MTDLPRPARSRPVEVDTGPPGVARPLAYGAALVGVGAPVITLVVLWAVGLVGWFASHGGSHGTTRSVLRVAADTWLLAHGDHLGVEGAVVTASPLGLTLASAYLTYRLATRAARVCDTEDLRTVGLGAVVLGGVYAVTAMLVAVLAATSGAQPGFGLAFAGGAVIGGLAGGAGLLRGAGLAGELRRRLPVSVLCAGYAALATVLLLLAAGAALVAVSLSLRLGAASRVADGLGLDPVGWLLSLVLVVLIAVNLSLLGASYLLGPGFAVGVGTVVSPSAVALGPVPAVPVLAALPPDGWAPGWTVAFLAVPVLAAAAGGYLAGRTLPTASYRGAVRRGLAGGALAAVVLAALVSQAGGSIGPGRMSDLGVGWLPVLVAGLRSLVPAAVAGAVAATWRARRAGEAEAVHAPRAEPVTVTAVVPVPRPASSDLSGEDTVALRLPRGR